MLGPFDDHLEDHHPSTSIGYVVDNHALRIQICPKKGINLTILLWGWDWDHQTYSREGYGLLGMVIVIFVPEKIGLWRGVAPFQMAKIGSVCCVLRIRDHPRIPILSYECLLRGLDSYREVITPVTHLHL